ncbi:ParM/StbA family protein [Priestia sp. FSL W8-0001]|uniref:ParM/StbA family protein n=1 Tax=unclassified Priestia TaxID=2800374 RepID=UPI0030F5BC77
MILGIDAGNYEVKVVNENGAFKFLSCLGEARERQLVSNFGDDLEYEYNGQKGFAGTLAAYESVFRREMYGDSKAHEDAKIRVLIGVHRYAEGSEHDIVIGQPISKHQEKEKMKSMLLGKHTLTLNGVTKTFYIQHVNVAPEGAGAIASYTGMEQKVRILDIGSGTVNCATIFNGRFIDRDSFTAPFGANTEAQTDLKLLAESIVAYTTKKWSKGDVVRVCGGISDFAIDHLSKYFTNIKLLEPIINGESMHPVFANAAGFYELGKKVYV